MKLSVSNIAWETSKMESFLKLLCEEGCDGLELSPSMVWQEPIDKSLSKIRAFGKLVRSFGLEFSSMHSLTYPRPELNFFDAEKRKELIKYIVELGKLADELRIPVMVFGSGKARQIGNRNRAECYEIMADAFRQMAKKLISLDVHLLIEPLSKIETDSINSAKEGAELVKRVGRKNFALHIDLKSTFMEREDQDEIWPKYISLIRHCHVADIGLKPPSAACPEHKKAAAAIRKSGYANYISLEIGRVSNPAVLRDAIRFVKEIYIN